MTAPNHALTGALIGLSVSNPLLALPLAFASHFVCDAIPHYDSPGGEVERIGSKRLIYEQLVIGGALCIILVICLALTRPQHWLLAAVSAFVATSPDLFWIPRFLYVRRTGKDLPLNRFLRFMVWIQWYTAPRLIWVEIVWFAVFGVLVISKL